MEGFFKILKSIAHSLQTYCTYKYLTKFIKYQFSKNNLKEYFQQVKKRKNDKDTGFCVWVTHITRQVITRKVKFITSQDQLDEFASKGTIGHEFLKLYERDYINGNKLNYDQEAKLWNEVKDSIYTTIGEKRCSLQTKLHSKWERKLYLILYIYILFY